MPIVSPGEENPFVDRRQSARALAVRTGVERWFGEMGWATLPELTLKTGRRADLIALSPKGAITIVEVKSSVADWQAGNKGPEYRGFCDQLFFATLPDVPADIFPADTGLIIADSYGADVVRQADEHRINAARRKELHLRFARVSASRLARCCAYAGIDVTEFSHQDED